jgi:hypothetical protein
MAPGLAGGLFGVTAAFIYYPANIAEGNAGTENIAGAYLPFLIQISKHKCIREGYAMAQPQIMTLHEKLVIGAKSIELEKQGKLKEAEKLMKSTPLEPFLAKFYKDYLGLDALLNSGWNLSEAEVEFGSTWLTQ